MLCSRTILLLIAMLLALPIANAHKQNEPIFLSLIEAITLTLSKNVAIQSAEMTRVLNKFSLKVADNDFDLQYSLTAGTTIFSKDANEKVTSFEPGVVVTPGVKLKNAIGTTFGVDMPQNVTNKGKYSTGAKFEVSQPLLRGAGRDVNLSGIRDTYATEIINKLTFRDTVSSTVIKVAKSYRSLISSNYTLAANQKSLEDARIELRNTEAKIKAGIMASTELVQAQAQYEVLHLQVVQQENDVNIARQDLLTEIGLEPEMKIVVPSDLSINNRKIIEFSEAVKIALVNNKEYRSALINTEKLHRGLKNAKNAQLWDLSLNYNATIGDKSITDTLKGEKLNHSLSVSLGIPIRDLKRQQTLLSAQISVKQNELTLAQSKRTLIANIKKNLFDINNLKIQVGFAKKSLELSEKSYEVEKKKQTLGKSTSLNVSNAQDLVLKRKEGLIAAKIAFENKLDDLSFVLGTTLVKWDIALEY